MDLVSDLEWLYCQDLTKRFTGVNCRFRVKGRKIENPTFESSQFGR